MPTALLDRASHMPRTGDRSIFPTVLSEWTYRTRKSRNWSQSELAQRVGISSAHVSKVEKGISKFSPQIIVKIAQVATEGLEAHRAFERLRDAGLTAIGSIPSDVATEIEKSRKALDLQDRVDDSPPHIQTAVKSLLMFNDSDHKSKAATMYNVEDDRPLKEQYDLRGSKNAGSEPETHDDVESLYKDLRQKHPNFAEETIEEIAQVIRKHDREQSAKKR